MVAEPANPSMCPVPHTCHAVHIATFESVLKNPLAQSMQAWSTVALPAVLTYSPATHCCVHSVQFIAFTVVLKLPAAQEAQFRSVVALPSAVT
jgi:hypothetical protein